MSKSSTTMRPSRGKVWLPLKAGQSIGRPLAEWGYRTPRFPMGIKAIDLAKVAPQVRLETAIVWFLANHVPAQGPYFGFSEAQPGRPSDNTNVTTGNSLPKNDGIGSLGWNQGRFFDGGVAADLLRAEFGDILEEPLLNEAVTLFDGMWEFQPLQSFVNLESQSPAQRSVTIARALDELAEAVRQLALPYGGIGHNSIVDDGTSLSEDDRNIILKASSDARIAVLSSDYSAASLLWETAKPIVEKIAGSASRHIDAYFSQLAITLGTGTGVLGLGYLGKQLGLWNDAQAITTMIELAKHL